MISGLFLQFLDRDELNIELCDAPSDTPLFASDSVQNEIETGQIICWLFCKRLPGNSAGAKSVLSRNLGGRVSEVKPSKYAESLLKTSTEYLSKTWQSNLWRQTYNAFG